jgi:hypothetical protein
MTDDRRQKKMLRLFLVMSFEQEFEKAIWIPKQVRNDKKGIGGASPTLQVFEKRRPCKSALIRV